jgi:hypothetical protein
MNKPLVKTITLRCPYHEPGAHDPRLQLHLRADTGEYACGACMRFGQWSTGLAVDIIETYCRLRDEPPAFVLNSADAGRWLYPFDEHGNLVKRIMAPEPTAQQKEADERQLQALEATLRAVGVKTSADIEIGAGIVPIVKFEQTGFRAASGNSGITLENGTLTLHSSGREFLRVNEDGTAFVRGEKVAAGQQDIYEMFRNWVLKAVRS